MYNLQPDSPRGPDQGSACACWAEHDLPDPPNQPEQPEQPEQPPLPAGPQALNIAVELYPFELGSA